MTSVFARAAELLDPMEGAWEPLPHQVPPEGEWLYWLLLAGRGAGKTDGGAAWLDDHVKGPPCDPRLPGGHRPAIIGPTLGDAIEACYSGPSGLKAHNPSVRLVTTRGGTFVRWPNGTEAKMFGAHTADDAERLRAGGNRCSAWLEEFAIMRYIDLAWQMLEMGLRVGEHPRAVITTTPKNRDRLKKLLKDPQVAVTRARTVDNPHLPEERRKRLLSEYEGTRLGKQELDGEIIEEVEGALWSMAQIDLVRVPRTELPEIMERLRRIVVAVDPSTGSGLGDECGIVVVGKGSDGIGYVLDDVSMRGSPEQWAQNVVETYHSWRADRVIAEVNYHAELVRMVLNNADPTISFKPVRATRGKAVRAEPVQQLYEAKVPKVMHVGHFGRLEEQMTSWIPPGSEPEGEPPSDFSPDRVDALVWALTELMLDAPGPAKVASARHHTLPRAR